MDNLWKHNSWKSLSLYFTIYVAGISTFLLIIADPFTMTTYFSDNSLLPGLVNREFSLATEAEYYLKNLEKFSGSAKDGQFSLATSPAIVRFIKNELDNFGLEVYEQNFSYNSDVQFNGTNIYSIVRGERSTSSESIVLCAPYKVTKDNLNSLSSVALSLALAKYFSTKGYWAKDVIVLFVDHDHYGASAWVDSYYDVRFRQDLKRMSSNKDTIYYDSLPDRSGPMQAAIILELYGREFTRINVKIQGMYGQLPNLDLFNLAIELAARESVTPYFHDKSMPFDLSIQDLYKHHFETAFSFMKTQASMQSDGLHGLFLRYAVQSLTLEGPRYEGTSKFKTHIMTASLLNVGRLVEGIFRSLNNLTERFNRSYYFYIILSLRRFTSIGFYMIAFGLIILPLLLKTLLIYQERKNLNKFIGKRALVLIASALILSLVSTINISSAIFSSVIMVPFLILI